MIDGRPRVRQDVVQHVEQRSRQLARIYHVPCEELLARYVLPPANDGRLVVHIRYAGHIMDKFMLEPGKWEEKVQRKRRDGTIRSESKGTT